jgi:hypothetical protein
MMTRRLLAIAVLLGVLAVACGKVGPPVRVRSKPTDQLRTESTAVESSETIEEAGASAAEESEEEENQP